MAKLPEIAKCACGKQGFLGRRTYSDHAANLSIEEFWVSCGACDAWGFYRKTERGAINAWNKLMEKSNGKD